MKKAPPPISHPFFLQFDFRLCVLISEIVYCKVKNKVQNAGPQLARVMNSMELQKFLKEALESSVRTLQIVSASVTVNMSNFFDGHDDTFCIT